MFISSEFEACLFLLCRKCTFLEETAVAHEQMCKSPQHEKLSCTKDTMSRCATISQHSRLPVNCRRLSWGEICVDKSKSIGKGAFGCCYVAKIGTLGKVCLKVLHADKKFKHLFYTEAKVLSLFCHPNIPWLYAVCDTTKYVALAMSFHMFRGENESVTVHKALLKQSSYIMTIPNWKQVILSMTVAIEYLSSKNVLHNDIKSDNVLIELINDGTEAKAVLIDFNKSCLVCEGLTYRLSREAQQKYARDHPQIAPEVRKGLCKQSFASDVYSTGRVIHKINAAVLHIPGVLSLSQLCLSEDLKKRPTASELHSSLSFLFGTIL